MAISSLEPRQIKLLKTIERALLTAAASCAIGLTLAAIIWLYETLKALST